MKSALALHRVFLGLCAFSILGTLAQFSLGIDPGPIAPAASALMLACGAGGILARVRSEMAPRAVLGALGVLALGAAAEIIGLATGLPFGRYEYTGAWPPSLPLPGLGSWPILLPVAWLMVIGAAWAAAPGEGWRRALSTAAAAAIFDLAFLEPVMAGPLGYWRWLDPGPLPGGAPLLNFFGWLACSLGAGALLNRAWGRVRAPRQGLEVLGGMGAFCAAILLWSRLWPPAQ